MIPTQFRSSQFPAKQNNTRSIFENWEDRGSPRKLVTRTLLVERSGEIQRHCCEESMHRPRTKQRGELRSSQFSVKQNNARRASLKIGKIEAHRKLITRTLVECITPRMMSADIISVIPLLTIHLFLVSPSRVYSQTSPASAVNVYIANGPLRSELVSELCVFCCFRTRQIPR